MENNNQVDKKKSPGPTRLTTRKGTLHTEEAVCKIQPEAIE